MVKIKDKEDADKVVERCPFWSGIPLTNAKINPLFQSMFDVVVVVDPTY